MSNEDEGQDHWLQRPCMWQLECEVDRSRLCDHVQLALDVVLRGPPESNEEVTVYIPGIPGSKTRRGKLAWAVCGVAECNGAHHFLGSCSAL
eukprot:6249202-Alexandrium_andersonii.AAC.1